VAHKRFLGSPASLLDSCEFHQCPALPNSIQAEPLDWEYLLHGVHCFHLAVIHHINQNILKPPQTYRSHRKARSLRSLAGRSAGVFGGLLAIVRLTPCICSSPSGISCAVTNHLRGICPKNLPPTRISGRLYITATEPMHARTFIACSAPVSGHVIAAV
jgi:hypothetical protein